MANEEHVKRLKLGVSKWNAWRAHDKNAVPDLAGIELFNVDLEEINLSFAQLNNADISHVDLSKADLRYANLQHVNLDNARLIEGSRGAVRFAYCALYGVNSP